MIRIHATKKLLAKLPVDEDGLLPVQVKTEHLYPASISETDNPLNHWHGNLLTLQRRNCILLVHDETRFPLFIPCLTKPDFKNLQWHFDDALMNTLLKIGANQAQLDNAAKLLQPLVFDSNNNRSVQGTLNRMAENIDHRLYFDNVDVQDLSPYRIGAWLAERPCNVKGQKDYIWPKKAILALLSDDVVPDVDQLSRELPDHKLPENVVSLASHRREKSITKDK